MNFTLAHHHTVTHGRGWKSDVRYNLENGYVRCKSKCPPCARSSHGQSLGKFLADLLAHVGLLFDQC
jgi:hypothetical protein